MAIMVINTAKRDNVEYIQNSFIFPDVVTYLKLDERAFIVQGIYNTSNVTPAPVDSDEEDNDIDEINLHMTDIEYKYESSICSSSSDESQSTRLSPVPDDANSKCEMCHHPYATGFLLFFSIRFNSFLHRSD